MSDRRIRRLGFGLATVLGIARRGFFIPYRYAGELPGAQNAPYRAIEAWFAGYAPVFTNRLGRIDSYRLELLEFERAPPPAPRWTQDWFPRLDGAAAYTLVRDHRPRRIVEVGSGHSTRFLARAVHDGGLATEITTIDPAPRASVSGLPVRHLRSTLQEAGAALVAGLAAGDLLLIDSSHIAMPGTDVDLLLGHIVPALPAGVLIHLHDIFLPDPYPEAWAWRGYNEQTAVAALLAGGGFEPLWSSRYVATRMAGAVAASAAAALPRPSGAYESSLWLKKTGTLAAEWQEPAASPTLSL